MGDNVFAQECGQRLEVGRKNIVEHLYNGEYFVQLGEVNNGTTSIVWLDDDKKPLSDQQVSDMYISITDYVRGALLENDKQTIEF